MNQLAQCKGCSLEHMAARIIALEAENAHLRMYQPARRATQNADPVKQINPTDWAAWGMKPPEYFEIQPGMIMSEAESDFYVSKLNTFPNLG